MAIINTLQKCLNSPYLFEDKEAPARIVELLSKAGDRLDAAVNLHTTGQGDPADIVFLSYEAMFCCLRALVYAKGYREYGLRCLLLACEALYVRTDQLNGELLRKFELAQRLKLSPADAVDACSEFVKRTLELLGQYQIGGDRSNAACGWSPGSSLFPKKLFELRSDCEIN